MSTATHRSRVNLMVGLSTVERGPGPCVLRAAGSTSLIPVGTPTQAFGSFCAFALSYAVGNGMEVV